VEKGFTQLSLMGKGGTGVVEDCIFYLSIHHPSDGSLGFFSSPMDHSSQCSPPRRGVVGSRRCSTAAEHRRDPSAPVAASFSPSPPPAATAAMAMGALASTWPASIVARTLMPSPRPGRPVSPEPLLRPPSLEKKRGEAGFGEEKIRGMDGSKSLE
jgi:hypothetical protein